MDVAKGSEAANDAFGWIGKMVWAIGPLPKSQGSTAGMFIVNQPWVVKAIRWDAELGWCFARDRRCDPTRWFTRDRIFASYEEAEAAASLLNNGDAEDTEISEA